MTASHSCRDATAETSTNLVPWATVFRKAAVQLSQKGAAMDWFVLRPMTSQPGAVALARYAPNCVVLFYDFMIGEARQCSALVNSSYRGGRQNCRSIEARSRAPLYEGKRWQQAFDATYRAR